MGEAPAPSDRIKPSLLDRLSDDEPGELRDPPHKRFATTKQLRESVVRDLGWLLNCVRLATVQELEAHPYAAKSVLNFGLPDMAGRTTSGIDIPALEQQLRQAVLDFEPRLLPSSVEVSVIQAPEASAHNNMQLVIEAKLFAHPVPLAVWLRTEIDLESGLTQVVEHKAP